MDCDPPPSSDGKFERVSELFNNLQKECQCLQFDQPELLATTHQLKEDYEKHPEDMPHLEQHIEGLISLVKSMAKPPPSKGLGGGEPGKVRAVENQESHKSTFGFSIPGFSRRPEPGYKSQLKMKVQLIVPGETFGAHTEILQKVQSENLKLVFVDSADCDVVLVFCVINTRVGADVEEAMSTIPEVVQMKPVFLVVMHHTRKENHPTDGVQWSTKYKNVKFHIDILFHQTKPGLLKCDKNNQAIIKLKEKCANYASK